MSDKDDKPELREMKPGISLTTRHLRAVWTLGYSLVLGDPDIWANAAGIWAVRLSVRERSSLAWAALMSLPADLAGDVAASVLGRRCGAPVPAFTFVMTEAGEWADWANAEELDAYCLASFRRMSPERQAGFLKYVQNGKGPGTEAQTK